MKITVDGLEGAKNNRAELEDVQGVIILARVDGGTVRAVLGEWTTLDMAMAYKSLTAGDDEVTRKMKMAIMLTGALPDFEQDHIVDRTEDIVDPDANPFAEFMEGNRE